MGSIRRLESWARGLKVEVYALYLAYRDPRVSWYARVFAAVVVGYAFSPREAKDRPVNKVAAVVIVIVWIALAVLAVRILARVF